MDNDRAIDRTKVTNQSDFVKSMSAEELAAGYVKFNIPGPEDIYSYSTEEMSAEETAPEQTPAEEETISEEPETPMNLNAAIKIAADWWTKKVSKYLGDDFDRTEELRGIFEKNIRTYIDANRRKLGYSQLIIGASGYRKDLDNIVTESVAEVGVKNFILPHCANLVLVQWYGHPGRYSVWAHENGMDDPDYKTTLLDVD